MIRKNVLPAVETALARVTIVLAMALASIGCDTLSGAAQNSSGTGASAGTGTAAAKLSKVEAEARDAALADVAKHFLKGFFFYNTATTEKISPFGTAERFLRQFRELTVQSVEPETVSAADRLNGFEWVGEVSLRIGPGREAGDPGKALSPLMMSGMMGMMGIDRPRGRWTQWVDIPPQSLRVWKLRGLWKVEQQASMLLVGRLPTLEDFQRAGVK